MEKKAWTTAALKPLLQRLGAESLKSGPALGGGYALTRLNAAYNPVHDDRPMGLNEQAVSTLLYGLLGRNALRAGSAASRLVPLAGLPLVAPLSSPGSTLGYTTDKLENSDLARRALDTLYSVGYSVSGAGHNFRQGASDIASSTDALQDTSDKALSVYDQFLGKMVDAAPTAIGTAGGYIIGDLADKIYGGELDKNRRRSALLRFGGALAGGLGGYYSPQIGERFGMKKAGSYKQANPLLYKWLASFSRRARPNPALALHNPFSQAATMADRASLSAFRPAYYDAARQVIGGGVASAGLTPLTSMAVEKATGEPLTPLSRISEYLINAAIGASVSRRGALFGRKTNLGTLVAAKGSLLGAPWALSQLQKGIGDFTKMTRSGAHIGAQLSSGVPATGEDGSPILVDGKPKIQGRFENMLEEARRTIAGVTKSVDSVVKPLSETSTMTWADGTEEQVTALQRLFRALGRTSTESADALAKITNADDKGKRPLNAVLESVQGASDSLKGVSTAMQDSAGRMENLANRAFSGTTGAAVVGAGGLAGLGLAELFAPEDEKKKKRTRIAGLLGGGLLGGAGFALASMPGLLNRADLNASGQLTA